MLDEVLVPFGPPILTEDVVHLYAPQNTPRGPRKTSRTHELLDAPDVPVVDVHVPGRIDYDSCH